MKNKTNILGRLIKDIFLSNPLVFILSIICVLLSSVGIIIAPIMLQEIVNNVVEPAINGDLANWQEPLINNIIILATCYCIALIGTFSYTQLTQNLGNNFMQKTRERCFSHMQDLPIKFFDQHNHGDIMSIYTNDIDSIRQFAANSLPVMFNSSFIVLVNFILMITIYSVWLAIVVLIGVIAMLFVTKIVGSRSSRNYVTQQKMIGKIEGFIEENMNGLKVIKSFCHEEESKKDFDKVNSDLFIAATNANKFGNILMPILGNIGNIVYIAIAIVSGIFLVLQGQNYNIISGLQKTLEIGTIVAFLTVTRQVTYNFSEVANQVNSIALAIGGSKRVYALIDEKPEEDNGYVKLVKAKYDEKGNIIECPKDSKDFTIWAWKHPHTADNSVTYQKLEGDIRMFGVDFSYDNKNIVLHDITLYAKPGQKVAFVGATGAGKTTITNLLNRFYDIADGKIRYDGININKICKKDLRRSIGMVLQDTSLFSGTVMDNIRYGQLDATDEQCIEAAKLANAHDFIERLPHGYQTMLTGDGTNLSQGQRQLLSIARCALHNAPVMILDEATSSIDTRTEALVTKGMDNLMKGRTVFVIAHRLSTIQNSDVIMVLDHGRIIERGDHNSLIAEQGVYYQLYTGAFELE